MDVRLIGVVSCSENRLARELHTKLRPPLANDSNKGICGSET